MNTSSPLSISTFIFVLLVVCVIGSLALAADEVAYNRIWVEDVFCDKCPVDKLPFSFVYDGQPSRKLIAGWRRTLENRKIDESTRQRTLTLIDPKTGRR